MSFSYDPLCEVLLEVMGDFFGSQPKGDQQNETSPRVTFSNDSEGGHADVGVTRRIPQDQTDRDRRRVSITSHQCKLLSSFYIDSALIPNVPKTFLRNSGYLGLSW